MKIYVANIFHYVKVWAALGAVTFHFTRAAKLSLGSEQTSFAVPAGSEFACPGETSICGLACYAQQGNHLRHNVASAFARNWVWAQREEELGNPYATARQIAGKIMTRVFRPYESGDFSSQFWVEVWYEVARLLPSVDFWAYTRSFHLVFDKLVALPNFNLLASCDAANKRKAKRFASKHNLSLAYGPWRQEDRESYFTGTGSEWPEDSVICPIYTGHLEIKGACIKCQLCVKGSRLQKRNGTRRHIVFPVAKLRKRH